jgi:hypothetical protein
MKIIKIIIKIIEIKNINKLGDLKCQTKTEQVQWELNKEQEED